MGGADEPQVERFDREFDGITASVAAARDGTLSVLADAPAQVRDDACLVVSELVTNAIEASPEQPYRLVVERTAGSVHIEVHNAAEWTGPVPALPPGADQVRGRGLPIVLALCGTVDVASSPDGRVVVSARLTL